MKLKNSAGDRGRCGWLPGSAATDDWPVRHTHSRNMSRTRRPADQVVLKTGQLQWGLSGLAEYAAPSSTADGFVRHDNRYLLNPSQGDRGNVMDFRESDASSWQSHTPSSLRSFTMSSSRRLLDPGHRRRAPVLRIQWDEVICADRGFRDV